MLGAKHVSQSTLGSSVVSRVAEHACGSQCFGIAGWDDGRGLLGLRHSVSSVQRAFITHEEVG